MNDIKEDEMEDKDQLDEYIDEKLKTALKAYKDVCEVSYHHNGDKNILVITLAIKKDFLDIDTSIDELYNYKYLTINIKPKQS